MEISLSLRMVLLVLGVVFIAAILFDSFRRQYKRKQRYKLRQEHAAFELSTEAALDEIEEVGEVTTIKQPTVSLQEVHDASSPEVTPEEDGAVNLYKPCLVVYVRSNKQAFSGYELLQALLANGLRFGTMNIFHKYQTDRRVGEPEFSLASANEPGTFDIHNMGSCTCQGLCLFMQAGDNEKLNIKRLDSMLETANQLADTLDGRLVDDQGQVFNIDSYKVYRQRLIEEGELV